MGMTYHRDFDEIADAFDREMDSRADAIRERYEGDGFGPRLWDADPEVCCAAFQLGACVHTEANPFGDDGYDTDDEGMF